MKSTQNLSEARQRMLRYLDGEATQADVDHLNRVILDDPEIRRDLARLTLQRVELFEIGHQQRRQAAQPKPSQRLTSFGSVLTGWKFALVSAAAVLLLGLGLAFQTMRTGWQGPQIAQLEGSATIQSRSSQVPARVGARLQAGDRLLLGPGAAATVGYPREGTQFRLTDLAQLQIDPWKAGKSVLLHKGSLTAYVAPQPAGAPLRLGTSTTEAQVLGTELGLSVSQDATRLEVWNGKIKLTRKTDGASALVMAGQLLVAAAGQPLRTEPLQGGVLCETWRAVPGSRVGDLTTNPAFPDRPSERGYLETLESVAPRGDFYGLRLRGWLHAPKRGEYTFFIAADDEAELWLSSNEDPEKKARVCFTPQYTNPQQWTKFPEQQSRPIYLEPGRKYYLEILMKQAGGTECLAVAWQGPELPLRVIDGQHLFPMPYQDRVPTPDNQAASLGTHER